MPPNFHFDLREAVSDITFDLSSRLEDFVHQVQRASQDHQGTRSIHEEATRVGRRAMVDSYKGSLIPGHAQYETDEHHGRGRLLAALESPKFFSYVDENRIGFGDETFLHDRAAHWRRLNFGAQPASSGVARVVTVGGARDVLQEFLWQGAPTAPFRLPVGLFGTGFTVTAEDSHGRESETELGEIPSSGFRGQQTGASYQVLSARRIGEPTVGVAARDFVGAGISAALRYAGDNYNPYFEELGQEIFEETMSEHSVEIEIPSTVDPTPPRVSAAQAKRLRRQERNLRRASSGGIGRLKRRT